jgi:hypothetical protein
VNHRRAALCCAFLVGKKDSLQRIFQKKCFLFVFGSVCRLKRLQLGGKPFADDERDSNGGAEVAETLCCGILVKRWDKCISVDVKYVEKYMFFPGSNITCFTF